MLNLLNHFAALFLSSGAEFLTVFKADQLSALVVLFLNLSEEGVYIAHIFWGLWMFPLGYCVYKSGFIPGFLGVLLMIGCFGYLAQFTTILFPSAREFSIAGPIVGTITEMLFALWLLIKGVNVEQWEKRASQSIKQV